MPCSIRPVIGLIEILLIYSPEVGEFGGNGQDRGVLLARTIASLRGSGVHAQQRSLGWALIRLLPIQIDVGRLCNQPEDPISEFKVSML